MTRTPPVKRTLTTPAADLVADAAPATPNDAPDDLQAMMAELAGSSSSSVTVYRSTKGQQLGYVFKCTPDAFSLDTLRDKYNGGEFRLFITRDGVLWKNKTVYVEPKQSTASEPPPTESATIAAAMREGFARQSEVIAAALRAVVAAPPPAAPSLFKDLDLPAAITAFAALLTTLRPPAPAAPVQPAGLSPDRAMELIMQGVQFARDLQSENSGDSSMLGLLREALRSPIVATAIQAAAQPAQGVRGQVPPRPALPSANPQAPRPQVAPPVPAPVASTTEPPTMTTPIQQYLSMLVKQAENGSDPLLYADLVLDNLDTPTLTALLQRPPTPVDALIADHPPVAAYREWFEVMVDAIAKALADEAQSAGSDETTPNASDSTAPAVPGATPIG